MSETESDKTPLQQKLDEFGQQLSKVRRMFFICIRNIFDTIDVDKLR